MSNFAQIPIHKNPLGQDIGLWVLLLHFHAVQTQIKEQRIEFLHTHFSYLFRFTERRPCRFLINYEVVSFLLEDLQHAGREGCLRQKLQILIGQKFVPGALLRNTLQQNTLYNCPVLSVVEGAALGFRELLEVLIPVQHKIIILSIIFNFIFK